MLQRQGLKNGTREKDPPKAKQPLRQVSEKKKKEIAVSKGKTPNKPIAHRSEKMKGIMAAIKPLYKSFLKEKPICQIRSPEGTGQSTCIHHTAGRGMERLMDTNSWEAACSACNGYVEKNDRWARDNGHKVSRLSNQSTNK